MGMLMRRHANYLAAEKSAPKTEAQAASAEVAETEAVTETAPAPEKPSVSRNRK